MRPPFAVWVQDRLQRRLKAEVVRLEEELQKMDKAYSSAEPAKSSYCLPGERVRLGPVRTFQALAPSFFGHELLTSSAL